MEHELLQMLHLPPQELGQDHLTVTAAAFFDVHGNVHFPGGGGGELAGTTVAADDDCSWWMEDLMQLGDELFGGGAGGDNAAGTEEASNQQPWQWNNNGGSPDDDDPPPSVSMDGGDGSPPSVEQGGAGELASEPHHRDDGDDASPVTRKRRDRSKTIVSERKRRVRMKEKLYELRSLVPNITKMDKASIIADAVVYVKNLQTHARKLREEVAALEAQPRSAAGPEKQQHNRRTAAAAAAAGRRRQERDEDNNNAGSTAAGARVAYVGAAQVGDGRFFVTVECERRDGVAAPLCAAVESLACFRVESSSLVRDGPDRLVSTLTLKVNDQVGDAAVCEGSVVKLLVMAALLKEGFRHEAAAVEIS